MSENQILPDDALLTAYALGELDPTEREAIERLLDDSPASRAEVEQIRELAGALTAEFRREPAPALTASQRDAVLSARLPVTAPRPASRPRSTRNRVMWLASLATMAAMIVVTGLVLPTSNRPTDPLTTGVDSNAALSESSEGFHWHLARQSNELSLHEGLGEGLGRDGTVSADQPISESRAGDLAANSRDYGLVDTADRYGIAPVLDDLRAKVRNTEFRAERLAQSDPNGALEMIDAAQGAVKQSGVEEREAVQLQRSLAKSREHIEYTRRVNASPELAKRQKEIESTIKREEQVKVQTGPGPNILMSDGSVRYPPGGAQSAGFQRLATARTGGVSNSTGLKGGAASPRDEDGEAKDALLGAKVTTATASGTDKPMSGAGGMPAREAQRSYERGARGVDAGQGAGFGGGGGAVDAKGLAVPAAGGATPADGLGNTFHFGDADGKKNAGLPPETTPFYLDRLADLAPHGATPREAVLHQYRRMAEANLGTEAYEPIIENPFVSAYEAPLSTFGVDVDTASYANVRRFLTSHQLPPPNAVRIEELVNYFSYDYQQPADDKPFAVSVEAGACPWNVGHTLVRVGLKGREIPRDKRPAGNFVFLVDVSGSMQAENKLPLVKMGLNLLTQQMTESDRVAIVTYSDTAVQRLESTNGTNKPAIQGVIDSLQAGGSTNGAGGIQLAYRAALDHFIAGGTNRVILCTDGDFNVGVSDDDQLVQMIQERARTKVFFSVFGFGMGNLKDGKLEKLADKGNGQYAYVDSQREAQKVFVEDLAGTLVTIAKDVKVQVEFNPNQVGGYRLIGYENRVMPAQDFNNDAKDAGDIGAGHTVTALYEVLPAGALPKPELGENLRYRKAVVPADGPLASELLTVKLRYKQPEGDTSTLVEVPVTKPTIELLDLVKVGEAVACAVQLRRLDARLTAKSLQELFGAEKQNSTAFEADEAGKRLLLRASPNDLSLVKEVLLQLGEGGSGVSRDFNWAAAVAAFGMILRDSQYRGQAGFDLVLELAQAAKGEDPTGRRQEFIDLVKAAKALVTPVAPVGEASPPPQSLTREQAEARASVNGKYKNLLRIIEAPEDSAAYGGFGDYGRWEGTSYRGLDNLPQGYWVYVAPHWYIWGDVAK